MNAYEKGLEPAIADLIEIEDSFDMDDKQDLVAMDMNYNFLLMDEKNGKDCITQCLENLQKMIKSEKDQ